MKRLVMSAVMVAGLAVGTALAQDAAPAAAPAAGAEVAAAEGAPAAAKKPSGTGFFSVVFGSGALGVILWAALFGCGAAAIYFIGQHGLDPSPEDHAADADRQSQGRDG